MYPHAGGWSSGFGPNESKLEAQIKALKEEKEKLFLLLTGLCKKVDNFNPVLLAGETQAWWEKVKQEQEAALLAQKKKQEEERQRLKAQYEKELAGLCKRLGFVQAELEKLGR